MGAGKGTSKRVNNGLFVSSLEPVKVAPFYRVEIIDPIDSDEKRDFTVVTYERVRNCLLNSDEKDEQLPIEEDKDVPDEDGTFIGEGIRYDNTQFKVYRSNEANFRSLNPEEYGLNQEIEFEVYGDDEEEYYFDVISFYAGKDGRFWLGKDANHSDYARYENGEKFPTDFIQVYSYVEAIQWIEEELKTREDHASTKEFYDKIFKEIVSMHGSITDNRTGSLPDINF